MRTSFICLCLWLGIVGCHQDECEGGRTKCDGNRLFFCTHSGSHSADYSKWREEFNCSDFNATCTEGETLRFNPRNADNYDDGIFDYYDHGCAVSDIICDGDTDLQCTEDNSLIVGCSYSDKPVAMIVAERYWNLPVCVERSDGLAGFAYLPGECVSSREFACLNDNQQIACDSGVWLLKASNCGASNLKCEEWVDSEGYQVSQCVNGEP